MSPICPETGVGICRHGELLPASDGACVPRGACPRARLVRHVPAAGWAAGSEEAELRKLIFAAVNGLAYGGGSEIAQSTDFIIASENATFGQPEAMIGLAAGGGSPVFLPRVLPPGRALQMLMTRDPISAQEAHRLGMVNELYAQPELMEAAHRIAEKIASNSPTAVQAVKRAVRLGQGQPTEQAIAIMMEAHWHSAVHPDRIEGIGAFNETATQAFTTPTTESIRFD